MADAASPANPVPQEVAVVRQRVAMVQEQAAMPRRQARLRAHIMCWACVLALIVSGIGSATAGSRVAMPDLEKQAATFLRRLGFALQGDVICAAVAIGTQAYVCQALGIPSSPEASLQKAQLLTTDVVGMEGYELRMWRTDIGPGVVGAKHYHPGTECIYVLEGALTLEKEGEAAADLKAGDAHCVPPRTVRESRNASTTVRTPPGGLV